MSPIEVCHLYWKSLRTHDGTLAGAVFTEDGVIDDGDGNHHSGRSVLKTFIGRMPDGLVVEAPVHWYEQSGRLTAFGYISGARFGANKATLRWVFHFRDGLIAHVSNSFVPNWKPPGSS